MRLTVGPLPAAVYWRRRGVVLFGLVLVTLIIAYACSGATSSSGAGPATSPSIQVPTSPSTSATVLHPTTGEPPTPTATPYILPHPPPSGPCADDEIALTATASPATVARGTPVLLTLTIKNISTRSCARDIGAEPQELRLLDAGGTMIWSSDDCNPNHSSDVETLGAGQSRSFTLTWTGLRSRSGTNKQTCANATLPDPGDYQLVARLDKKMSAPFTLHITA